jgi:Mrp family chromosome partitioning ATPase
MKKYTKPTVNVVELQAKENIAANPLAVSSVETSGGRTTTTYNLALISASSMQTD